jgi:hypothetical protein
LPIVAGARAIGVWSMTLLDCSAFATASNKTGKSELLARRDVRIFDSPRWRGVTAAGR